MQAFFSLSLFFSILPFLYIIQAFASTSKQKRLLDTKATYSLWESYPNGEAAHEGHVCTAVGQQKCRGNPASATGEGPLEGHQGINSITFPIMARRDCEILT